MILYRQRKIYQSMKICATELKDKDNIRKIIYFKIVMTNLSAEHVNVMLCIY